MITLSVAVPVPEADPSPAAYASDYSYYLPANSPSSQFHSQVQIHAEIQTKHPNIGNLRK